MSYENAPATKMLATHCAVCSRELVDAVSVETGVGPECRKKHGYDAAQAEPDWAAAQNEIALAGLDAVTTLFSAQRDRDLFLYAQQRALQPGVSAQICYRELDARRCANVLVHRIAVDQSSTQTTIRLTNAVRALGFHRLADRIALRLAKIEIRVVDGGYDVKAPYSDESVAIMRRVPGRHFHKEGKEALNFFPTTSRAALFEALKRAYPGHAVRGPNGLFTLADAA